MCGIAGILQYRDGPRVDEREILAIRDAQRHRGPDGEGLWLSEDGRIALGHRRLAIVDLSPLGLQPMATPDGRLRVYETRDAGSSWTPRGDGLPQEHAYLTILREAFDRVGEGAALELYFGATSGSVYGSGDAGANWAEIAANLPPVFAVSATRSRAEARS